MENLKILVTWQLCTTSSDIWTADKGFHSLRGKVFTATGTLERVLDLLEEGKTEDEIYTDCSKEFEMCETNVLIHPYIAKLRGVGKVCFFLEHINIQFLICL